MQGRISVILCAMALLACGDSSRTASRTDPPAGTGGPPSNDPEADPPPADGEPPPTDVVPPGSIRLTPAAAAVTTRTSLLFVAAVGGTGGNVVWSTSAGEIDAAGLFTAPRVPGSATVTAAAVSDTTISASVTVTVRARSTPNVVVAIDVPASDVVSTSELFVSASITTRYWLERVEADVDGLPFELGLVDGSWCGRADVSALSAGVHLLRIAAVDFAGAETEVFRQVTVEP